MGLLRQISLESKILRNSLFTSTPNKSDNETQTGKFFSRFHEAIERSISLLTGPMTSPGVKQVPTARSDTPSQSQRILEALEELNHLIVQLVQHTSDSAPNEEWIHQVDSSRPKSKRVHRD